MGNCCGKPDAGDTSQPRFAGSASAGATTASVPRKVGGPGRTLGGPSSGPDNTSSQDDARLRAAEAAEARAKAASTGGGKLQSQLAAQKKQTRNDTLKEVSDQALRQRDSASAAEARNWN
ncbi:hypothetical protein S40285_01862 [Stachybotrys chlorohalonatus IBT 40285]|uniref:Uncharacterized protein n=1 Tax=Stachybotrys chlorohalonatus (strain IBT 40285) TaxID=1283841 RepID=A0A084QQM1_STAC4|nr:hypothetical protein S40285_01862 [Stachybotrys chlorohalonata IBT 40285]